MLNKRTKTEFNRDSNSATYNEAKEVNKMNARSLTTSISEAANRFVVALSNSNSVADDSSATKEQRYAADLATGQANTSLTAAIASNLGIGMDREFSAKEFAAIVPVYDDAMFQARA